MTKPKGTPSRRRLRAPAPLFEVSGVESVWSRLPIARGVDVFVEDDGERYRVTTWTAPGRARELVGNYTFAIPMADFAADVQHAAGLLAARQRRAA